MRIWLSLVACLLLGCQMDPRPQALRRGMDQVRSVLADPRLKTLADAQKGAATPEERLVQALFSYEARKLWPPRLEQEVDYRSQDQSKLPGRIAYLTDPDLPWAVVVKPDAESHSIQLLGFGARLDQPLFQERVPVQP